MHFLHRCPQVVSFVACLALLTCMFTTISFAWIYPEHRDITFHAVQKLDPGRRAVLDRLER